MFVIYLFFIVFIVIFYIKYKQTYWKRHGLYQFNTDFFIGTERSVATGQENIGEASLRKYKILKNANLKHGGSYLFMEPIYMPIDPYIIKHIMQIDFHYFINRGQYYHSNDKISMNLFNIENDEWKNLRAKLTPTFTSGKMKMMFQTILDKAVVLDNVIENYVIKSEKCDLKEMLARFTTDVIGSVAFGFECNSLNDQNATFRKYGNMITTPARFRFFLIQTLPWKILSALKVRTLSSDVNDFFVKIVQDTIKYRETNNIFRKDFMQLLLDLKNQSDVNLTEDQIIAQCFIFFAAGFETSSTTTTFAIYELTQNLDIQEKLRKEIMEVLEKYNGNITYEAVMEMNYLDKVVNETLRKYPTVPVLPRECNKDYNIPETDFTIKKGTRIAIPVWAIQNDPEYYPNPDQFNPENFNEENKAKRPDFTYFPFGEGPRICIGLRFGKLQSKIALITLLRKYKFRLNKSTDTPLKMKASTLILIPKGNLWFDITRL